MQNACLQFRTGEAFLKPRWLIRWSEHISLHQRNSFFQLKFSSKTNTSFFRIPIIAHNLGLLPFLKHPGFATCIPPLHVEHTKIPTHQHILNASQRKHMIHTGVHHNFYAINDVTIEVATVLTFDVGPMLFHFRTTARRSSNRL